MSTQTAPLTATVVTATEAIGDHIREAASDGYGLVPRSSTGPARHGRGTPGEGARLLDLSALRAVPLVSERERVAIVEAGVTFAQLEPLLAAEGLRLCHPLLPPAGKSVVASVMDREPHLVPKYHWDFTDPLLCAELWFGTGDRFRTGSAAGPGKTLQDQWKAGMFQKNPFGPAQTDLVKLAQGAQGALGVAAWASLRLERVSEQRRHLLATSDDIAPLSDLVSRLTRRRIGDEMLILDRSQVTHLASALGIDPPAEASAHWVLLVIIGSLPRRPDESISYQLAETKELASTSAVALHDLTGSSGEEFTQAITGVTAPTEDWKRYATGTSSELSFLTTLDRAEQLAARAQRSWTALLGDEAVATYIQPVNQGRTCHVEVTAFVETSSTSDLDAITEDLADQMVTEGAFFSRPVGPTVDAAYRGCGDVVRTLQLVKQVIDPDRVLSPGALCFDPSILDRAQAERAPGNPYNQEIEVER